MALVTNSMAADKQSERDPWIPGPGDSSFQTSLSPIVSSIMKREDLSHFFLDLPPGNPGHDSAERNDTVDFGANDVENPPFLDLRDFDILPHSGYGLDLRDLDIKPHSGYGSGQDTYTLDKPSPMLSESNLVIPRAKFRTKRTSTGSNQSRDSGYASVSLSTPASCNAASPYSDTYGAGFEKTDSGGQLLSSQARHEQSLHHCNMTTSEEGSKIAKAELLIRVVPDPYVRPQYASVCCKICNIKPNGFRGDHELRRHMQRAHAAHRKVWICFDPSPSKDFLSGCKACMSSKRYNAYYNAAAHLRRSHFSNKTHGTKDGRKQRAQADGRGGKGGGNDPPMSVLKTYMKSFDLDASGNALDSTIPDEDSTGYGSDKSNDDPSSEVDSSISIDSGNTMNLARAKHQLIKRLMQDVYAMFDFPGRTRPKDYHDFGYVNQDNAQCTAAVLTPLLVCLLTYRHRRFQEPFLWILSL